MGRVVTEETLFRPQGHIPSSPRRPWGVVSLDPDSNPDPNRRRRVIPQVAKNSLGIERRIRPSLLEQYIKVWTSKSDDEEWRMIREMLGISDDKNLRIGIGIYGLPCAGICETCRRTNIMEMGLNDKRGCVNELRKMIKAIPNKENVGAFVITGGVVGDPLLDEIESLRDIMHIVSQYGDICIINTEGNMYLDQSKARSDIVWLKTYAKTFGLKLVMSISVALEQDYVTMKHPMKSETAFQRTLDFVKMASNILGNDRVILTFVDTSMLSADELEKRGWPQRTAEDTKALLVNKFDMPDNQIIGRSYWPTREEDLSNPKLLELVKPIILEASFNTFAERFNRDFLYWVGEGISFWSHLSVFVFDALMQVNGKEVDSLSLERFVAKTLTKDQTKVLITYIISQVREKILDPRFQLNFEGLDSIYAEIGLEQGSLGDIIGAFIKLNKNEELWREVAAFKFRFEEYL